VVFECDQTELAIERLVARAIFVTDYRTGRMLEAGSAWFVPTTLTSADGKKSEPNFVAFRSREDANAFSSDATLRRWTDVLAEAVPD